ncbi:MAG: tetratricopeptide repeat protein [Gammaproteobacteria bacterium]|nr:tetratricopeptide repeat protein [Gammaproteobacteria bacterium]
MSEDKNENQEVFLNLKKRLNENLNDIEAATLLGNIYYDNQEPAQAIVYYRIALDIDPTLVTVRTDMGTMYWQIDNVAHAEEAYRRVIKEQPGFGNAYLNLGFLLMHAKNEIKSARAVWTDLITGWPKDPAAPKIRDLLVETMN